MTMPIESDIDTASPEASRGELQSLVRGIQILDLFADGEMTTCRVSQVEEALAVPASTAYRLIRVLKLHGLLEDGDSRGTFRLGPKLRVLGERVRSEDGLLARMRPLLEGLRKETGETVLFTIRRGDEAIHIDVLDSDEEVRVSIPKGRRMHIAAGGSGRVILAHLRPREIERILAQKLPAYTPHTVTEPELIRTELQAIRRRGYSISESQTTNDTRGVCVPVLDAQGLPLASLTLTGPSFRMDETKVGHCLAAARRAVALVPG